MNFNEFENLMQDVAKGWNSGDASQAIANFSDDAVYVEPPDNQFFQGRDELFSYFGGAEGLEMKLTWHGLFFNDRNQSGAGEYTFEMNGTTHHGVAVVELEKGKIRSWREYDVPGRISFAEFIGTQGKQFKFTIKDLTK